MSNSRAGNIQIAATQSWEQYRGFLSNMDIEIAIDGKTARVDLTFYINVDSSNSLYGSLPNHNMRDLEARLDFTLPSTAYFYDSYLWLNPQTIIRARLSDVNSANQTYDSIVARKVDPSILQKTYGNNYSLKVFPISTTYSRQVKISYSVPISAHGSNKEYIEMPWEILSMVGNNEKIRLILNNSSQMTGINTLYPLTTKLVASNGSQKTFEINRESIPSNKSCFVEYENQTPKTVDVSFQTVSSNEKFYSLRARTDQLSELSKATGIYEIKIPMKSGGFLYHRQNNSWSKLNPNIIYSELGRIEGEIDFSKQLELNFKIDNVATNLKFDLDSSNKSDYLYQDWTKLYTDINEGKE
ncbi:MAG: VIT domain-containing protein, partial [Chitinophagales bacterium]